MYNLNKMIMDKIKVYRVASTSGKSSPKGSLDNPYTVEEYEEYLDSGKDWPGGYVKDMGYVAADTIIVGSYPSDDSWWDSWEDSSWSDPWGGSSSSEESSGSSSGSSGGGGASGGSSMSPTSPGSESISGGGSSIGKPSGSRITLDLRGHTEVSQYSRNILKSLVGYEGKIVVTSTYRTPEGQARVMLANIKETSVDTQKGIYGKYGDKVIDVYRKNVSDAENIAAMAAKIKEVGPRNVSHHCFTKEEFDRQNVLDISAKYLSSRYTFVRALEGTGLGIKIIDESSSNGCVHIEIPQ